METCVWVPALLLRSCVILDRRVNLSGSQFTHLANGDDINIPSLQSCEYPME